MTQDKWCWKSIRRRILTALESRARRQALGELGRRRFETDLAWGYSVAKLLEAYQKILPGPRRTAHNIKEREIEIAPSPTKQSFHASQAANWSLAVPVSSSCCA